MVMPIFSIEIDGKPLSEKVKGLVQSIEIKDEVGSKSDTCSITFSDRDGEITPPRKDVSVKAFLGYDGTGLVLMGRYTVSGFNGQRGILKVRAKGFDQIKKIRSSFDGEYLEKSIADIVSEVAGRNGLVPRVSDRFKDGIHTIVQKNESDLSFLARLAKEHSATFKVQGEELLFVDKGRGESSRGEKLPEIPIKQENIISWNYDRDDRDSYGEVSAQYVNRDEGIDEVVKIGSGDPKKKLDKVYTSEASARAAIKTFLHDAQSSNETLTVELIGDPTLKAERRVRFTGFRDYANGVWIITSATHVLGQGYKTSLTLKKVLKED